MSYFVIFERQNCHIFLFSLRKSNLTEHSFVIVGRNWASVVWQEGSSSQLLGVCIGNSKVPCKSWEPLASRHLRCHCLLPLLMVHSKTCESFCSVLSFIRELMRVPGLFIAWHSVSSIPGHTHLLEIFSLKDLGTVVCGLLWFNNPHALSSLF